MKRTKRILLIEDDKIMAEMMRKILLKAGYRHLRVITSSTYADNAMSQHKPDLLLLDIMLPWGDDGRHSGLCLKENEATADLPFLVFTALSDAKHISLYIKA